MCPILCNPTNGSMPAPHEWQHSITNSRSPPKPMSIESVMPSNHLILCCLLLLLPPIPPSIRGFSSESTLHMRWPGIGVSASASVLSMNTQDWSPLGWTGWISLQSKGLSRVFFNTTQVEGTQGFLRQPGKHLERPSSTRLEARFPYHGSGAMTCSHSPLAWRPDFPGAPREAH